MARMMAELMAEVQITGSRKSEAYKKLDEALQKTGPLMYTGWVIRSSLDSGVVVCFPMIPGGCSYADAGAVEVPPEVEANAETAPFDEEWPAWCELPPDVVRAEGVSGVARLAREVGGRDQSAKGESWRDRPSLL